MTLTLLPLLAKAARGHEVSVSLAFRVNSIEIDSGFGHNREALDSIQSIIALYTDSVNGLVLSGVEVIGSASPEGGVWRNGWLSKQRARRIFDYVAHFAPLPDSLTSIKHLGRDWHGALRLVTGDTATPSRERMMQLMERIIAEHDAGTTVEAEDRLLGELMDLDEGRPFRYILDRHFPRLRSSRITLRFETPKDQIATCSVAENKVMPEPEIPNLAPEITFDLDTRLAHASPSSPSTRPFYMAVESNLLFDILGIPNIGAEIYLGGNTSLAANWMYAWWSSKPHSRFWRIYGGDASLRRWFGRAAHAKPLTGHHLGVYGGIFTYDFEWGGRGYMGGQPGGSLWDNHHTVAGLEYGYSHPIASRLNLDFTIGAGYCGGIYHEYIPVDGRYIRQVTKQRRYTGLTKAKISLVWLIGRGNINQRKATSQP